MIFLLSLIFIAIIAFEVPGLVRKGMWRELAGEHPCIGQSQQGQRHHHPDYPVGIAQVFFQSRYNFHSPLPLSSPAPEKLIYKSDASKKEKNPWKHGFPGIKEKKAMVSDLPGLL